MTIQEILKSSNADEVVKNLSVRPAFKTNQEAAIKQYNVDEHDIFNEMKRPNKTIGEGGSAKIVKVARIGIPFQKIITARSIGFMLGNKLRLIANIVPKEQDAGKQMVFDSVNKLWDDNKLDFKNKQIAQKWLSELEVAELWYLVQKPGFWNRLKSKISAGNVEFITRMKILSPSNGDTLYPHYDDYGNMDAFSHKYTIEEEGDKLTQYFDVYTDQKTYRFVQQNNTWQLLSATTNTTGKIPVIYYRRDETLWADVQSMIDKFEKRLSDLSDENDYSGHPLIKVWGTIKGFAAKDEQGKLLQFDGTKETADAEYLTNNNAPDAIKLELDTLREHVYNMTQTPDISFTQMKSIGAISGIALKLLFLDAHMKAVMLWGEFGEGIQRRLNLLKAIVGNTIIKSLAGAAENLSITPEMTPYLPTNETETINMLVTATGGQPVMSRQTAVKLNPLVEDADSELQQIETEQNKDSTSDIFNPTE